MSRINARDRALEGRVRAGREVGEQQPGHPGRRRLAEKALESEREDGVEIRHDDDRDREPRAVNLLEHPRDRHTVVERGLRGALNGGAVGEGVRERHADFDEVGSGTRDYAQRLERNVRRGKPGGEVWNQGGAPRAGALPCAQGPPARGDRMLRQSSR